MYEQRVETQKCSMYTALYTNDTNKKISFLHVCLPFISVLFFTSIAVAQFITADTILERVRSSIKEKESKAIAESFKGITINGKIFADLYPIKRTGVSAKSVRKAAKAFLALLKPEQYATILFAVDDDQWRKWHSSSLYARQGISFKEMNEKQKIAALSLLRSSLSAQGLKLTFDIRHLNQALGESLNDFTRFDEDNYWITLMGTPSDKHPWGWQMQGHHLTINYFVLGDQVVMTPTMMCAGPVRATSGKYAGTIALQDEQNKGLSLINALTEQQQKKGLLSFTKTGNNILAEVFSDNIILNYSGICATELNKKQQDQLIGLIAQYVDNIDSGHARVKMNEVRRHIESTYFAWVGKTEPGSIFYYRVQSPVIIIEFDHQVLHTSNPGQANLQPSLDHIHTMVRTPNGNDYGKSLLRQHYKEHPHKN